MAGELGRAPGSLPQFIPVRRSRSVSCRRRPVLVSFTCLLFFCDSAAAGQGNRVEDDLQQYGGPEGVAATGYNSGVHQSSNVGPSPLAAGQQGLAPRTRDRNRPNRRSRNAGGAPGASSSNSASSSAYHAPYNSGVAGGGATRFALTPGLVQLPVGPLLQRASSGTTTSSSTHTGIMNNFYPAGDLGRPSTRSAREEQGGTSNFYASGFSTLEPGPQSSLPSCSGDVVPAHLSSGSCVTRNTVPTLNVTDWFVQRQLQHRAISCRSKGRATETTSSSSSFSHAKNQRTEQAGREMSVDETSYYRPLYNRNGPAVVEEEELLPAGGPASTRTAPQMLTSTPLASSSSCEASTNTDGGCEVVDNNCSSAPSAATGSGRARLKNRKLIKMGPTTPGAKNWFGIGDTTKEPADYVAPNSAIFSSPSEDSGGPCTSASYNRGPFLSSSSSSSNSWATNQNYPRRQESIPDQRPQQEQPTAAELCQQILQLCNVSARSTTDGSRRDIAVDNFGFPTEQQAVEDLFRRSPTPATPNALFPVEVERLREQGLDTEPWFERMQSEEMSAMAATAFLQDRTDNDHAEQGLVAEDLPVHVSCWPPEELHRRAFLEGHRGATGTTPVEKSGAAPPAPPSWSTSGSSSLAMHPPHIFNLRYCNNSTTSSATVAPPGFEEQVTEPQFQPFVPLRGGEVGTPAMGSSSGTMLRLAQLLRQPSSHALQAEANGLREVKMPGPGLVAPAMEQDYTSGPQQAEQQRVLDHVFLALVLSHMI